MCSVYIIIIYSIIYLITESSLAGFSITIWCEIVNLIGTVAPTDRCRNQRCKKFHHGIKQPWQPQSPEQYRYSSDRASETRPRSYVWDTTIVRLNENLRSNWIAHLPLRPESIVVPHQSPCHVKYWVTTMNSCIYFLWRTYAWPSIEVDPQMCGWGRVQHVRRHSIREM